MLSDENVKTVTVSNAKMNKQIRNNGKQPPGLDFECFNCGKISHHARNYRQPKRNNAE